MRFILSRPLERALANSDGDVAEDVEALLSELGQTNGVSGRGEALAHATTVALGLRSGGLLLTLLDERERPMQMFPIDASKLGEHLDLYEATIAHLGDPESLRGFEALDYGKRIAHNQAAEALQKLLEPVLDLQLEPARLLFSLVFVLLRRVESTRGRP